MGGESCSKRKGGGSDSGDKREGWKIWQQDDAEDKIKSDTTHRSLGSEKRGGEGKAAAREEVVVVTATAKEMGGRRYLPVREGRRNCGEK